MKRYKVVNKRKLQQIVVSVDKPLVTDEDVLWKTGWDKKDCIIEEVHTGYHTDVDDNPSHIDYLGED